MILSLLLQHEFNGGLNVGVCVKVVLYIEFWTTPDPSLLYIVLCFLGVYVYIRIDKASGGETSPPVSVLTMPMYLIPTRLCWKHIIKNLH